jgi:hypothetical protein
LNPEIDLRIEEVIWEHSAQWNESREENIKKLKQKVRESFDNDENKKLMEDYIKANPNSIHNPLRKKYLTDLETRKKKALKQIDENPTEVTDEMELARDFPGASASRR